MEFLPNNKRKKSSSRKKLSLHEQSREIASIRVTCLIQLLRLKKKVYIPSPGKNFLASLFPTNPSQGTCVPPVYLLQVLHDGREPLVFCLHVGDHGAALFELVLHLQDLPQVVGLLGRRLLQKRFLPGLPVLGHFAVDGEGLPERLRGREKREGTMTRTAAPRKGLGQMLCFASGERKLFCKASEAKNT